MWSKILGVPTIVQCKPHVEVSWASRTMSKGANPQDQKTIHMGIIPCHTVKWKMISKGVIPKRSPVEGH